MSTTARELTAVQPGVASRSREWQAAAQGARLLSWLSLAWMGAEGAIAITAGVLAGSIALISFGLDSAIEGFASPGVVLGLPRAGPLPPPPRRGGRRPASPPARPPPSSSACSGTRSLGCGGSTRPPRLSSPASPSRRDAPAGAGRAGARHAELV